jgi:RNA polymerase sigma-70 factor (ECF subfamily)
MNDSEIIKLIIAGDQQIFRILVEKHQSMVFRTCIGFVHDKDDADDLTQDIFIQVYQSLHKFKGEASFSTWLYRIAVNASLNRVRKNVTRPVMQRLDSFFQSVHPKELLPSLLDTVNPESILISKEHTKWVQNALDSLPENQRTAIVLSKYDDLPQKEIAEIMKTTEGAVEALIQRAKANLRIKLVTSDKRRQDRRKSISFGSNHKSD